MPRRLDHLVICVPDLAQAALDRQTLGFSLTPTGVHPFGTSNRLACAFGGRYDLDATTRVLKDNGVNFEVLDAVLLVPPAASHGPALEFIEQETI